MAKCKKGSKVQKRGKLRKVTEPNAVRQARQGSCESDEANRQAETRASEENRAESETACRSSGRNRRCRETRSGRNNCHGRPRPGSLIARDEQEASVAARELAARLPEAENLRLDRMSRPLKLSAS